MKLMNTSTIEQSKIKLLVYGEPGAGKTTLARTIKEPTLIVSAEAGLLSLSGTKIDVVDITTDDNGAILPKERRIERLAEVYKFLLREDTRKKYSWIFIDSLTEIGQNLVEQLQQEYPDRSDSLKLWGDYATKMRGLIKSFRDLPYYNVVFTALTTIDKDDVGNRYRGVDLQGRISDQLPAYFDEVFFLFVKTDEEGGEKRVLLCHKTNQFKTKDRSGKLNKYEPADLSVIIKKIRSKKGEK